MTTPTLLDCPDYAGHRFPAEVIGHAVWLSFRFPLSLHHVDELLATRGIVVSHEAMRQWDLKFGRGIANRIRRRLPQAGDKWHLDEVAVKLAGKKHWLWRSTKTGSCWISSCGAGATRRPPSACSGSC